MGKDYPGHRERPPGPPMNTREDHAHRPNLYANDTLSTIVSCRKFDRLRVLSEYATDNVDNARHRSRGIRAYGFSVHRVRLKWRTGRTAVYFVPSRSD